jgi:biopolymer transport protein ExbD
MPSPGEGGEGEYRPLAEINVTPMVDVMLVLLIIFMVTAPLLAVGVPLELPKTSAIEITQPKRPIVLSIDRAGDTFIGSERVAGEALEAQLARLAAADPGRVVYVRGDRAISYARLMDTLGLVNAAGFTKVSLVAEGTPGK